MQVVCGQCSTRFAVPDEKVRGRHVRVVCGRCGAAIQLSIPPEAPELERPHRNPLDTIPTTPEELARLVRLGTRDSHSDTQPNPIPASLLGTAPSGPEDRDEGPLEPAAVPAVRLGERPPAEAPPGRPVASPPHFVLSEPEDRQSMPQISRAGWWLGVLALMAGLLAASMAAHIISPADVVGFIKGLPHRLIRSH